MNTEITFSPYFDQESQQVEITGMIADFDVSPSWELDAAAVFKARAGGYLVVFVSGCSCWPDRGTTIQIICKRKADVDKQLREGWHELLDKCQANNWKPAKE